MERHTWIGYQILAGSGSALLELGATIALTHHEKWDGSGYPRQLSGSAIPMEGQVAAVADVFDALTSDRPYRKAFPLEDTMQIMRQERGKHFDPRLDRHLLRERRPAARDQGPAHAAPGHAGTAGRRRLGVVPESDER